MQRWKMDNFFSDKFIPENLLELDTTRAFIGFERKHDVKTIAQQDLYEISVTWNQMLRFIIEELSLISKRYHLTIVAEGIIFDLEIKQHVIVNQLGELLLNVWSVLSIIMKTTILVMIIRKLN